MGKTKTVILEGLPEEKVSGKEVYEKKRKKKEIEAKKQQIQGLGLKGGQRIKLVLAEVTPEAEVPIKAETEEKVLKKPKKRGKKYQRARSKIDKAKVYHLQDAVKLVKETSYSSFDGTVELHLVTKRAGISQRVSLPYKAGKQKKVEIASDETIEKLKQGKVGFDVLLATPDMMPNLVPFAKILGPKGLMPNPKAGTLIKDEKDALKFSGNTISVKTEKDRGVIHTTVGKVSQEDEELIKNSEAILEAIDKKQILKAYMKSTMGPSVKISI